jgi:hypothetical protein
MREHAFELALDFNPGWVDALCVRHVQDRSCHYAAPGCRDLTSLIFQLPRVSSKLHPMSALSREGQIQHGGEAIRPSGKREGEYKTSAVPALKRKEETNESQHH